MNTYTDTQGVVHHIYANLLPGWLSWETTIADGFGTSTSAATPHTDSNGNAWITANSAGSTQIRAYVPGLKGGNWYSNFYTTVTQPTIQSVSAGNLTYNGSAQTPSLTVTGSTGKTLTQGTDYKITSITNDMTNAGSKSVTVTGIGSYSGTKTATFSIDKCPIGNCFANIPDQTYTGSALTPDIDSDGLHCYSKKWVEGTDWYKGAYVNNVDSKAVSGSKAHLTVYGKGNFTGSMDVYFTINQRSIDTCWANIPDQTYTGSALTPDIDSNGINLYGTKWVEGTDWYKGAYVNNVDSKAVSGSKAHLTVYGKGNFTGSMDVYFTINQASLSNATITSPGNQTYTGSALTPKPAVKMGSKTLAQNNDYALSYSSNNVSAGNTVTITITGQNNYSGTAYTTFNIVAPSVANASVTVPSVTYSGTPQRPVPTSVTVGGTKLYLGTDYRISNYSNNTNAGTASLTITGLNNYAGSSKIVNFTINPAAITSYSFSTPTLTYNGYAQRPDVPSMATNMGTLHESSPDDYDITYSNNVNAGTAGIAFQFKNNFTGTGHSTFTIGKANISAAAVSGLQPTYSYTGFAIKPALTLRFGPNTLTEGTDYYLSYFNNTSAGTATIQITGTGTNFTGTTMRQFSITQNQVTNNLSAANIAAIPTQTFTGSAIRPALSVVCNGTALKQDTDYTVSYSNNIHAGTATVTVRGMGSYTGAKTTTFAIKSADPIRKAGLGALDTMEQIVDAGWTQSNCQTVVIATNGGYWDALSACSEAGLKGAPVILTNGGHLSAQARDEINRLGATNAVIIGGEGAITEDVVWQLETTTSISSVTRHAGASAADTARDIYENETGWGSTCIIATSDGFQDALAAAPFSYAKHAPMFLAESGSRTLSAQTLADIRDGGFTNVIIIGGECAVSPTVERQLSYAGVTGVTRIGGDTAYDTCQQFDEWALGQGMSVSRVGLATGEMYYDALAGAALCGKNNSVIALTSNGDSTVIDGIVRVNKAHVDQPYVFGGWGVVSDYTLAHLRSVLL